MYSKKNCYTARTELIEALKKDFEGCEKLQNTLSNKTPKYGNDDEFADCLAAEAFNIYYDCVNGRSNTRGGKVPGKSSSHNRSYLLRLGGRSYAKW